MNRVVTLIHLLSLFLTGSHYMLLKRFAESFSGHDQKGIGGNKKPVPVPETSIEVENVGKEVRGKPSCGANDRNSGRLLEMECGGTEQSQ